MTRIKKKFIEDNAIDGSKLLVLNNEAVRARNAADNADIDLMKLDVLDKLQILVMPQVSSDPVNGNDLTRKSWVDAEIAATTSDLTALEGRVDAIEADYGVAGGLATLGLDGKVPSSQLPALALTDVHVVADIAARDALTVEEGDVAKVIDAGAGLPRTYIYDGSIWIEIESGSDVASVNGQVGAVVLTASDIGSDGASTVQADINALESEDLLFLKLDGSRPMSGTLNMNGEVIDMAANVFVVDDPLSVDVSASISPSDIGFGQASSPEIASYGLTGLSVDNGAGSSLVGDSTSLVIANATDSTTVNATGITGSLNLALETPGALNLTSTAATMNLAAVGGIDINPGVGFEVFIHEQLNMQSAKIVSLADGVAATDAATKGQVDSAISTAVSAINGDISALQAEDLTFLKLDGTRAMTDSLNMGGFTVFNTAGLTGDAINVTATVGALALSSSAASATLSAATSVNLDAGTVRVFGDMEMQNHVISELADGSAPDEAVNKGQLDALEVTLQGYIDALEAASVEFVQEKFVLTAGNIADGYIDLSNLAYIASINAFVDRLAIHETDDYTVSSVSGVTRITFAGSLITAGQEKLSAGDVVRVKYAKVAIV